MDKSIWRQLGLDSDKCDACFNELMTSLKKQTEDDPNNIKNEELNTSLRGTNPGNIIKILTLNENHDTATKLTVLARIMYTMGKIGELPVVELSNGTFKLL